MPSFRIEDLHSIKRDEWNDRVKSVPEGTFYQTTHMAEWQKAMHSYAPLFLTMREGPEVLGQLLFFEFFYAAYSWSRNNFLRAAIDPFEKIFRTYTWFCGPLIFKKEKFPYLLKEMLRFINSYIKGRGGLMIRNAVPPIHNLSLDQSMIESCFKSSGYKTTPRATIMVNTARPLEELWAGLKRGSRHDVRKTSSNGVALAVEEFSVKNIKEYYSARLEAAKKQRSYKCSFDYLRRGLSALKNTNAGKFFISSLNNIPLSFNMLLCFNGIALQNSPFNSNYCLDNRLRGNHFLTWKIIEWAHKNNFRWFDLTGVNPVAGSRTPKEEGIFKFKTRWGGLKFEYAHYDKVFSQTKHKLIERLKKQDI